MRCVLLFVLTAFVSVNAGLAQTGERITADAISERTRLVGQARLTYLLRQVDLTEEQAAHAKGLLESIVPGEDKPLDVDEVRKIWAEMEQAKQAGDKQKVEQLTKQLQQMGKEATGDDEFLENIKPHLTEAQQAKLAAAITRLERNPSGSLRPVDLLRAARGMNLSTEQQGQLRDATAATRKALGPILRPSEKKKLEMINLLAEKLRTMFDDEQRTQLEHTIRALRPDLVNEGLRVTDTPAKKTAPAKETQSGE